jgi:hypothetical protein
MVYKKRTYTIDMLNSLWRIIHYAIVVPYVFFVGTTMASWDLYGFSS